MWMILDIIIIAIFVVFAIIGMKKGLIKSLMGTGVVVLSIIITMNCYTYLADFFRTTVVYRQLTDNLNEKIEAYVSDAMDEGKLLELFEESPAGISALLSGFGVSTEEVRTKYSEMLAAGEENIAASISDYIVMPAAKTLSNALAVIAVFLASVIVLSLVVLVLDLIFKLPILNLFNRAGGLLGGLVTGLLICFVFCTAVNLALPYLPGAGIKLDSTTIENTLLFSKISEINPLSFLYK